MNPFVQIIGILSAILTTAAFLPQVVKTWRTRSTSDLSPLMFALFCFGIVGWLFYGIFIKDLPIILANAVTICLAGTIMFFILKGGKTLAIIHVALYVDNLESMKSFYCTFFNGKANKKYTNPARNFSSYFISLPSGQRIELMKVEGLQLSNDKQAWGHFAISCGSIANVNDLTEKLKINSVNIISEPRQTGDGFYESSISDPEGNIIELTT
jgi:lactoylglutathione lyase